VHFETASYALKSRNTCHFLIGLELSTQGCRVVNSRCSRISVLEESMVQWRGQTYFALWKIVGNYLLSRKIWNHFASSRFLLLHLHKISQKITPIPHMQISLFSRFMVLLPYIFSSTPSVPNYLSILIVTQILRNLWGICKNVQLGFNLDLHQLSNELFCTQNKVVKKRYDGLIRLQSSLNIQFSIFLHQDVL
jgi:hypothetical protein